MHEAFETELAALIERHGRKLSDNQIITGLERALDEALVQAGDPEPTREAAPSGWLDISTAPRDGSSLLLICASAYTPTAAIGWWNDGWYHYSRPDEKWHGGVVKWFPTHWMPRPTLSAERPSPRPPTADEVARIVWERFAPSHSAEFDDDSNRSDYLRAAEAVLELFQPEGRERP